MIHNPYDHALKILAQHWPDQFLQLGFPNQSMRLIGTLSNVELALEIDRVDFLHEIEINDERGFFHIDFQLEHEEDCRRRFFVYNGMLTEMKKPSPIITVPVYLRPRVSEPPESYEVKIGGILFHTFTYKPIVLSRYVERIRSGEMYIFAPLLPVLTQPMSEALLIEERRLIQTYEKDPARQQTLLTTAILIAAQSKLFNSDFLWELFKEDPMDINDPVISKLFDRFYGQKFAEEKQKMAQAMETEITLANQRAVKAEAMQREAEIEAMRREAEIEAMRRNAEIEAERREAERLAIEADATRQWQELMFKVIEHRFQSIPVALILLLQRVTPEQRSQVSDLILDAPDVTECLQRMQQLFAN